MIYDSVGAAERATLDAAVERVTADASAAFLLGVENGFRIEGLASEYDVPEPVFMIIKLLDGDVDGLNGVARYHDVFRNFA